MSNQTFDNKNFTTSSYDISSCFSASSLNFNFLSSKYVALETRICGKDVDGVTIVYNFKGNNKRYVTCVCNVDEIDTFIKREVI